uniref:Uncharacterized protein n=1 Tax=Schizaphis graminum TaxID=13262 RepID=A0A2S2PL86_SCHGA
MLLIRTVPATLRPPTSLPSFGRTCVRARVATAYHPSPHRCRRSTVFPTHLRPPMGRRRRFYDDGSPPPARRRHIVGEYCRPDSAPVLADGATRTRARPVRPPARRPQTRWMTASRRTEFQWFPNSRTLTVVVVMSDGGHCAPCVEYSTLEFNIIIIVVVVVVVVVV